MNDIKSKPTDYFNYSYYIIIKLLFNKISQNYNVYFCKCFLYIILSSYK